MLDVTTLQIFTFRFSICSFPWRLGTVRFKFYAALSSELCTNPLPEMHIRVETFRMERMAGCSAIHGITFSSHFQTLPRLVTPPGFDDIIAFSIPQHWFSFIQLLAHT